jgi:hypothetical protein
MVACLAPVAVMTGGSGLVDEVLTAVKRVLRWWP